MEFHFIGVFHIIYSVTIFILTNTKCMTFNFSHSIYSSSKSEKYGIIYCKEKIEYFH